jgi:hypothetical protein
MYTLAVLVLLSMLLSGCRAHYSVLPSAPYYRLNSPDGRSSAFPDSANDFGNVLDGWIDLGPAMSLKLEKAYFLLPESRRIQDYLGLESAHYVYETTGALRLREYLALKERPVGEVPVSSVLPRDQLAAQHHRFFFQIVLSKEFGAARAVLLSGNSKDSVANAARRLLRGEGCAVSVPAQSYCTAMPDTISASLAFEIKANGKALVVPWGSSVANVVRSAKGVKVSRRFRGKLVPVQMDPLDPAALRLPLWPGDSLTFETQ